MFTTSGDSWGRMCRGNFWSGRTENHGLESRILRVGTICASFRRHKKVGHVPKIDHLLSNMTSGKKLNLFELKNKDNGIFPKGLVRGKWDGKSKRMWVPSRRAATPPPLVPKAPWAVWPQARSPPLLLPPEGTHWVGEHNLLSRVQWSSPALDTSYLLKRHEFLFSFFLF